MGLFGNREPYEPQDTLIIFKEDHTADVAAVVDINDERLFAESSSSSYSIPNGDYNSFTGRKGRIFLYPTTVQNVTDCERIAALERSTVLRQITHFQDDLPEHSKSPMGKMIMIGLAVLVLIILVVK